MPVDLNPDEAVTLAADWLMKPRDYVGRAIIPELRQRFVITTQEALEAVRMAQKLRGAAYARST